MYSDYLVPINDPLTFEDVGMYKYFQIYTKFIWFYMADGSLLTKLTS